MQLGWCFSWIIQLDHAVIVAAVNFRPMRGGGVGGKRSDVPRADVDDVGHFSNGLRCSGVRLG